MPRVLSEPIGGSKLSLAMQRAEIKGLGRPWPTSPDQWRVAAQSVRGRFRGDAWLRQLAPALGETAGLPALARAASDGVVVTTGQQAGLFGGPMLTLVKALSARALADSIERLTGMPCATVFWAATDDADFVEAASVKIPATGDAKTLALTQAPPTGTPMSRAPIAGIGPLLDAMAACCGSSGDAAMEVLRRAYRDGATIGDAYLAFMRELLAPWGIAVLDGSHPAVLQAARPIVLDALRRAGSIEKGSSDWNESLVRAGLKPQVESVPGLSLVFANENGIKRRVPVSEAAAIAATDTPLSPNVLLRPIVEAAILPTVAYTAGPGELAYFAQVPPIADGLGVAKPIAVPRWSTTIVEPAIDRILERYGVSITDLRDYDGLLTRLVRDRMPAELASTFAALRSEVDRAADSLRKGGTAYRVDPKIMEGIQAQLALRVDRGERRVVAALKRHDAELRRDLGTARASLYPGGVRQERALSFVPFVARYDGPLIERMLAEAGQHADGLVGGVSGKKAPVIPARP